MESKLTDLKANDASQEVNDGTAKRTCILVLGMHRSGTSAITRVLSYMGATLPLHIMGPAKGNEAGHWEPKKLVALHDELLAELDSSWDDWQSIDLTQLTSDRLLYYKNQIKKLIKDDFKDAKLFVLKDPRVCKLLSFYKEIFAEIDVELKIVSQFRNPIEVMDSLKTRDGMLESDGALLWLDYVLNSERASRGLERVFIKYDDVINDWKKSHESIRNSLDINWPYGLDEIEDQVDQFISPKLCHHSHKDEEVLFDPLLRQWVSEAYSALLVLLKKPDSKNAQKRLEEIADEFEKASPMLVHIKSSIKNSFESVFAERNQQIAQKDEVIAERDRQIAQKDGAIADNNKRLSLQDRIFLEKEKDNTAKFEILLNKNQNLIDIISNSTDILNQKDFELNAIKTSKSWKYISSLRNIWNLRKKNSKVVLSECSNALKHFILHQKQNSKSHGKFLETGVLIACPPHVLTLANLFSQELRNLGFKTSVETDLDNQYSYQHLFVFCPNVFSGMKSGYVAIQLEQTTSSRWFTTEYIAKLHSASIIIDYSKENIQFLRDIGFPIKKLFYVPLGVREDLEPLSNLNYQERQYDVLFYGDVHCERRKNILGELSKKYNIIIESNKFGPELWDIIKNSKCVLNLHYYDTSLLETTRILECLGFNTPVVSEESIDVETMDEFQSVVNFAKNGDITLLEKALEQTLNSNNWEKHLTKIKNFKAGQNHTFRKYFRRVLYANNFISLADLDSHYLTNSPKFKNSHGICLTLPETLDRYKNFKSQNAEDNFISFDGVRHKQSWVGCGLSFKFLMKYCIDQNVDQLTVCEDDVNFPKDYDIRKKVVHQYLEKHRGEWDLFSGFMSDISNNVRIKKIEDYRGVKFIWLDRAISMVYNIYTKNSMKVISEWDPNLIDSENNTIDRYLENHNIRVVMAFPFLVDHDDNLNSSIWGFKNSQYNELIEKSNTVIKRMIDNWEKHT